MSAPIARLQVPDAFRFLWTPARYKGAWGGRGTGKSHSFAAALVIQGFAETQRVLCCREVQNSIGDSVKQLLDDKIREAGLTGFYTSTKTDITAPNGTRFMFAGLKNETVESLKSKEGVTRVWIEEAHRASRRSLDILIPTIRAPGSEIWASWNPENAYDPIDQLLRGDNVPPDAIVRKVSYQDNPWFPDVLRKEMEYDRAADPQKAAHIWDGDYRPAPAGAYYAELLARAMSEGRITRVPHQPGVQVHVSFDLGVGKNMALWFTQRIGREIRVIRFIQGNEQAAVEGLSWYIREMRALPYDYAPMILPHDARHGNIVAGKGAEATLIESGFKTLIVPAMSPEDRIDLVKRTIPMCVFDADNTADGLFPLREYRENYDEKLKFSRGPLHNWASHAADSFGHMCQGYEAPRAKPQPRNRPAGSWLS